MESNSLNNGILVTSDPYSDIINSSDPNTSLLFGDGATATLISNEPNLILYILAVCIAIPMLLVITFNVEKMVFYR